MSMKTTGTQLYYVDPYDNTVNEVDCPDSASITGGDRNIIEVFCLASDDPETHSGRKNTTQANFMINYDSRKESHIRLKELFDSGERFSWAFGLSDALDVPPTADSDGEVIPAASRSWITFEAFVSSYPWDANANAVYTANLSLSISGPVYHIPATA